MVFVIWENWKAHVCAETSNLFGKNTITDVILKAGSVEFKVHSFVLFLFSEYFQKMIASLMKTTECELPIHITLSDYSPLTVECIVTFMYFGEVTVSDVVFEELSSLSKLLGIKGLDEIDEYISESDPSKKDAEICDSPTNESIEELIANKRIPAEIIRVHDSEQEVDGFSDGDFDGVSDGDLDFLDFDNQNFTVFGRSRKRKKPKTSTSKKKVKAEVSSINRSKFRSVDEAKFQKLFLDEIESYLSKPNWSVADGWPLSDSGLELHEICPYNISGNIDPDDPDFANKMSMVRLSIEMSYIWHRLTIISRYEREQLVHNLRRGAIEKIYQALTQSESGIVKVLKNAHLSGNQILLIMSILFVNGVSIDCCRGKISTFCVNIFNKARLEAALLLYQTSEINPPDIANQCWVSYKTMTRTIRMRKITRPKHFMPFNSFLEKYLKTSKSGANDFGFVSRETEKYLKDAKKIEEFYDIHNIDLPLQPYIDRIYNAITSYRTKLLSLEESCVVHMVYYDLIIKLEPIVISKPDINRNCNGAVKTRVCGRKSAADDRLIAAIREARTGVDIDQILKKYSFSRREKRIINFNARAPNPPIDDPFEKRFEHAIHLVQNEGMHVSDASCLAIVLYKLLRFYWIRHMGKVQPTKERLHQFENKRMVSSKNNYEIGAAIKSVRSGTSLEQVYRDYNIKEPINRNCIGAVKTRVCGRKSAADDRLIAAIREARTGVDTDQILKKYSFSRREKRIINFNATAPNPPIDDPFEKRFEHAIHLVQNEGMHVSDASCLAIVLYKLLRFYWIHHMGKVQPTKERLHQFENKRMVSSKKNYEIRAAIKSVRSGTSLEQVYRDYNIKEPDIRNLVEYNSKRLNPPLDARFELRLVRACEAIHGGESILSAGFRYIFDYKHLVRLYSVYEKESDGCSKDILNVSTQNGFENGGETSFFSTVDEDVDDPLLKHYLEKTTVYICNGKLTMIPVENPSKAIKNKKTGYVNINIRMINAISTARKGTSIEQACREFAIDGALIYNIVEYNVLRADEPPLNLQYKDRLLNAVKAVVRGESIMGASYQHIISPVKLRFHPSLKTLELKLFDDDDDSDAPAEGTSKCVTVISEGTILTDSLLKSFLEKTKQLIYEGKISQLIPSVKNEFEIRKPYNRVHVRMRKAILEARFGTPIEQACREHEINDSVILNVVEYNVKRPDEPPLNIHYNTRYENAVDAIQNGDSIMRASFSHVINPLVLFKDVKTKTVDGVKLFDDDVDVPAEGSNQCEKDSLLKSFLEKTKRLKFQGQKWQFRFQEPPELINGISKAMTNEPNTEASQINDIKDLMQYVTKLKPGYYSKVDTRVFEAIKMVRRRAGVEEACQKYGIIDPMLMMIVEYNGTRPDAPLFSQYVVRLAKALDAVCKGESILSASFKYIIGYTHLSNVWENMNAGKREDADSSDDEEVTENPSTLYMGDEQVTDPLLKEFLDQAKDMQCLTDLTEESSPSLTENSVGLHSQEDNEMRAAIKLGRLGFSIDKACAQHSITDLIIRLIVEYNVERPDDPPINVYYRTRLQNALKAVQDGNSIMKVSFQYIINPINISNYCEENEVEEIHFFNELPASKTDKNGHQSELADSLLMSYIRESEDLPLEGVMAQIRYSESSSPNEKYDAYRRKAAEINRAVKSIQRGTLIELVFNKFDINDPVLRAMVKYNYERTDSQLGFPYNRRLRQASRAIERGESILKASFDYVVIPENLVDVCNGFPNFTKLYSKYVEDLLNFRGCPNDSNVEGNENDAGANESREDGVDISEKEAEPNETKKNDFKPIENDDEGACATKDEGKSPAENERVQGQSEKVTKVVEVNDDVAEANENSQNCADLDLKISIPNEIDDACTKKAAEIMRAVKLIRKGNTIEHACNKFDIKDPVLRAMVEHNSERSDSPLGFHYSRRLRQASRAIQRGESILKASFDYVVLPETLVDVCKESRDFSKLYSKYEEDLLKYRESPNDSNVDGNENNAGANESREEGVYTCGKEPEANETEKNDLKPIENDDEGACANEDEGKSPAENEHVQDQSEEVAKVVEAKEKSQDFADLDLKTSNLPPKKRKMAASNEESAPAKRTRNSEFRKMAVEMSSVRATRSRHIPRLRKK